jgi:hypothetical protein
MRFGSKGEEKLKFVLCRTCAAENNQDFCRHADDKRWLEGTWFSEEIRLAISKGYRLILPIEIYHYPNKTKGLFADYINTWLKLKTEASGWPRDNMTDEEKTTYIIDYKNHQNIQLERTKICANPSLRSLAKLKLNALWGKFGQAPNLTKATICRTHQQYWDIVTDQKREVVGEEDVADNVVLLMHRMKDESDCDPGNTSVAIAAMVTAYGRIMLYKLMDSIESVREGRLLYFDTGKKLLRHILLLTIYFCRLCDVRSSQWRPRNSSR